MASTTAPIPPNPCVNCAVRFQRNVQSQLLSETTENVRQLVREWISRELNPLDAVCLNCLIILQESTPPDTRRRFGYRITCIPCGASVVLVNRLEQVCRACWLKASRAVSTQRQQDTNRAVVIQPVIAESIDFPPPPSRYYCNCLVGRHTVGCAHVMSVVWFLSWARYQDQVEPPASFLDEVLLLRDDFENE